MTKKKVVACIAETLAINMVIYYFFFRIQPNQDMYLHLNPHPLFLLCIAMGLRYGNYLGIVGAVISSLFYTKVFLDLHGDILLLFGYLRNYKYILSFFWGAMVLGIFKDNYKASIEKLFNKNKLVNDNYNKLNKEYELTQKIQQELKKQIIGSEESILHLYEIASRLETLDSEEVYTETMGILSKYLKADTISIYTYHEASGYLRLKIGMGDIITGNRSMLVKESIGFSKVVFNKQVLRWTDIKEDHFPLMSAPIIKDHQVVAIVNIEHMDFDRLSEYAFQLFKLIIEWVNKALDQAIYVDGLKKSKYIEGTKVWTYESFEKRLKEEERRKHEFGMGFVFAKYRVKELSIDTINERMGKFLRTVDVVSYDPIEKTLFILLPATPKDNIHVIEGRIFDSLGDQIERIE